MTTRNKTLLQRADIALSDLAANGGLLDAEQANAFIDMVMEQPTILRRVRTIRMTADRKSTRLNSSH